MRLQWIADHFQSIQWILLLAFVLIGWISFRKNEPKSQFRVREADLPPKASEKPKKPVSPLELPGIRLDGKPHEILGIPSDADEAEIIKAHKELIKRFHPDRIQASTPEMEKFYQSAAVQINRAKEMMLKKIRDQRGVY